MTTTTTRYGLTKIQPLSDNVDVVADFNNNWDGIDQKLGTQVSTSSTRPSSPVQGQLTFETDTGYVRKYNGSAWSTAGNANATSGSLPANPIQADLVYLNDIGAVAYYSGSAWHTANLITCTSTTRPTGGSLQIGSFIYETDTLRLLVYNGATWVSKTFSNFVCTSTTHPSWAFQGLEIYETDTGLSAVYNGSSYLYALQQITPTQALGSATASVTFSSIPSVFSKYIVFSEARSDAAVVAGNLMMQLNGDTATTYQYQVAEFSPTLTTSESYAQSSMQIGKLPGASASSRHVWVGTTIIGGVSNFANLVTPVFSSGSGMTTETTGGSKMGLYGGQHLSASSITSIKLFPDSGNFVAGSRFTLYGVM